MTFKWYVVMGMFFSSVSFFFSSTPSAISDDALAQILSMGFPMDLAQTALIMTQGDTERAVNLLVSDPDW